MSSLAPLAIVLLAALAVATGAPLAQYPELVAESFAAIRDSPAERFVYFYFSSTPQHAATLATLSAAAKRVHRFKPSFLFSVCDGDDSSNSGEFASAGFNSGGEWLFTSTPIEGIMKYTGPVTAYDLTRHVRNKYLPYNASDVLTFSDEDEFYESLDGEVAGSPLSPSPIFVKFYEQWCQHCQRLAPTFSIAATVMQPTGMRFMEVECSKSSDTQSFCAKNGVSSYPVLMLFTGESKLKYEAEMRSVDEFDRFFITNVPGYQPVNIKKSRSKSGNSKDSNDGAKPAVESVKPVATATNTKTVAAGSAASSPTPSSASASLVTALAPIEARLSSLETAVSSLQSLLQKLDKKMDNILDDHDRRTTSY